MNFLTPMAFVFAATIPIVVLFYLLKRRRVVRVVSSSLLWQKFLAETQASAPFQKLRKNWLLFLQLLMLILAILALGRPYLEGKLSQGGLVVVILDASASMKATDVEPTRFESAREEVDELISSLGDQTEMILLLAGGNTQVKQSATSNKGTLRDALESCEPTDSGTRLIEALKLAQTLIMNRPDTEIHLFSDGAGGELEDFHIQDLPVEFHKLGESSENLAVVTMDVRMNPEDASQRAIFASVVNYGEESRNATIELYFNDGLIETKIVELPKDESVPVVFLADQFEPGVFEVRLEAEDILQADNRASIPSLMPQPAKVLLVTQGNRFLEKALRASGNVEVTKATDLISEGKDHDIVVVDSLVPSTWPAVNTLMFKVTPPDWFGQVGMVEGPRIVSWRNTHPLMRFMTMDNVAVREAAAVSDVQWGVPIVEAPQSPLIVAGEVYKKNVIWVAFDALDSTWPLRVSFPIFVSNAMDWLNPALSSSENLSIRAGAAFRLPLADQSEPAKVIMPDGSEQIVEKDEVSGQVVFGGAVDQGVYRLVSGTNETLFCANILDSAESRLMPVEEIQFGKYGTLEASTNARADLEIWRWFLAFAFAVLMFEWWFYHRRTA